MVKYRTIRLPEDLIDTVENIIKEREDLGYRSKSEFVIDAVRRRAEKLMNSRT